MGNWLTEHIKPYITEEDIVLDLCCGISAVIGPIKAKKKVGADIYQPYVDYSKKEKLYDDIYCIEALTFAYMVESNSFDVVICLDGVEHLEQKDAEKLIDQMERIAKKRVVIFTPVGFTENDTHDAWGIDGGDIHQKHKSGFKKLFFKKRGYDIKLFDEPDHQMQLCVLEK